MEGTTPPQATYSLTALGSELATPLCQLIHWIGTHTEELLAAQRDYDKATLGKGLTGPCAPEE